MESVSLYIISLKLLLSLIVGILFGIERDLKGIQSGEPGEEEAHFGGTRTFALIGLLGGLCAYTGVLLSHPIYVYGFVAVAFFVVASYIIEHRKGGKLGMTTEFSALLTYTLGALSVVGRVQIVIAATIVILILLSQKKSIRTWGARIKPVELLASLKFALVLLVIFPFLKDVEPLVWHGITIIDPFKIWKMVVLISSVSYLGYFLTRVIGEEKGLTISGFLGGIASSTAVTHAMSTQSKHTRTKDVRMSLASATLFANAVSFLRGLAIIAILNVSFFEAAWLPLCVMSFIAAVPALIMAVYGHRIRSKTQTEVVMDSPFSLKPALIFGFLFALVLLLVQLVQQYAGNMGLYFLSVISGFPDIDAITVTLASLAGSTATMKVAVFALVLALSSNLVFKCLIARIGGVFFWKSVCIPLIATLVGGISAALILFIT